MAWDQGLVTSQSKSCFTVHPSAKSGLVYHRLCRSFAMRHFVRHFGQPVQPRMAVPELAPLGSGLLPLDGCGLYSATDEISVIAAAVHR
jgi:hypothetical protein